MTELTYEQILLLDELREAWTRAPQLRLGQLIVNQLPDGQNDPFYITDRELADRLMTYARGPQ